MLGVKRALEACGEIGICAADTNIKKIRADDIT